MIDEGTYKTTIRNLHQFCWKIKFFNSADVYMLGHGCGVSHNFITELKKYQMLSRPCVGSYSGEKGHQFWQEPWILE